MIPRETGRGLSISGAHRVAAVERLVGATLVVALPPNGATVRRPLPGLYRTGGVERRISSRRLGSASGAASGAASSSAPTGTGVLPGAGRWRRGAATQPENDATPQGTHTQGVPLRSSGIGPTGRLETALPVGDWKSPLRASGMIPRETGRGLSISGAHRVAAVERLVGATLVVALPPNGATVRRPLPGLYRTGGVERRISSRRLGSASGAASGAASSSAPTGTGVLPGAGNGDVERRLSRGTMQPRRALTQGVPLRSSGDWSDRAARNRPSSGRLEVAPPGKEHGARGTRPSQSARETRRSKRRPEGRRSQSAPRTTPLLPGVRHWKFQRKRRRGDRKVPPPGRLGNRLSTHSTG